MLKEIDQIFNMLDWNNDTLVQQQGIALASEIQHLSVFMQPIEGKSLWENCAKVIIAKDDAQLSPYLVRLFQWLQDMNWPGAELVYTRLLKIPSSTLLPSYKLSVKTAVDTNDLVWKTVLADFWKAYIAEQNMNVSLFDIID